MYLPPVLAGLVVLSFAAWSWWTTGPWSVPVAGCLALVLLAGSATLGRDAILFRLAHSWDLAPFLSDTCQLLGELVTVTAAIAHYASTRR